MHTIIELGLRSEADMNFFNPHNIIITYRPINNIRGFTPETLSAFIVDIESRESRRQYNAIHGIPCEHSRASTTDNVECFFSFYGTWWGKTLHINR